MSVRLTAIEEDSFPKNWETTPKNNLVFSLEKSGE